MSTNYYYFIKNKEAIYNFFGRTFSLVDVPEFGYEIHVAKVSCGWIPLFQAHEKCRSVEQLKKAYDRGEFRIIDEYLEELSWEGFTKEVLCHNGGVDGAIPKTPVETNPHSPYHDENMPEHIPVSHFEYANGLYAHHYFKDEQGYEFTREDFV